MGSRTTVIAQLQIPAWHHWPNAPDPVRYLAGSHRHLLGVRVEAVVTDTDRQVEFHLLRGAIAAKLGAAYPHVPDELGFGLDLGPSSMEFVAGRLLDTLRADGWPVVCVECWEDGENGSRVEYIEEAS